MESKAMFLDFNGKKIIYIVKNGMTYIGVRSVCEAIGVQFRKQNERIKADPILKDAYPIWGTHLPGDRTRELRFLPESLIYGWLFSIQSDNVNVIEYKRECYRVLYDHFHGSITGLREILNSKDSTHAEIVEIEDRLRVENTDFKRLEDLRGRQMRLGKSLKQQLDDIAHGQLSLFQ